MRWDILPISRRARGRLNLAQGWRVHVRTDAMEFEDEFWYGSVTNLNPHRAAWHCRRPMNVVLDDGLFELVLIRRPPECRGSCSAL